MTGQGRNTMGKLTGAPRKKPGHKKHSKDKPVIPDLDQRLKDANPKGVIIPPPEDSLTSETVSARLESVLGAEAAAAIEMTMFGQGAGAFASLTDMQKQAQQLQLMPAVERRQMLLRMLEVSVLQAAKLQNDTLGVIADPTTTEPAREVLLNRLGKFAFFNRSVGELGLAIKKAGFLEDGIEQGETDPADLSLEDWEKRFHPRLLAGGPGTETKQ